MQIEAVHGEWKLEKTLNGAYLGPDHWGRDGGIEGYSVGTDSVPGVRLSIKASDGGILRRSCPEGEGWGEVRPSKKLINPLRFSGFPPSRESLSTQ